MATAAGPAVVRSTSRRQGSYNSSASERHQRTPSASLRSSTTPNEAASTEYQQQSLAGVGRRDYETTNVARPSHGRRSSSRDPAYSATSPREDSRRTAHHRDEPRSVSKYSSDNPRTPSSTAYGSQPTSSRSRTDHPVSDQAMQVKKRTTITAQTGTWSLGKTIGAGSMGKVKLAKNMETGETVSVYSDVQIIQLIS